MHTRGLSASGSSIVFEVADASERRLLGTAYGLDVTLEPTNEAIANARLWAGASDVVFAAQIVINLFRGDAMADWAINDLEAAINKAAKP